MDCTVLCIVGGVGLTDWALSLGIPVSARDLGNGTYSAEFARWFVPELFCLWFLMGTRSS